LPQEDRTAEQFLQDSDREAHLIRLVLHGLAAPRPDELIEVRLTMGRGRVYLRGRNVLFSEHAHVGEGLQVAGDEETMKRISVLLQLLRERTDGALLHPEVRDEDRKSTRLNSSHLGISYAVFCLKEKSTRLLDPAM